LGLAAGHSCLLSFDADPTGAPLSLPGSVDIVPPSAPPVFPSGGYRFGQRTFAAASGSGGLAPLADLP
jgi:hypothetical protein